MGFFEIGFFVFDDVGVVCEEVGFFECGMVVFVVDFVEGLGDC